LTVDILKYEYSPELKNILSDNKYRMSDALLQNLNITRTSNQKIGMSEERIKEILPTFEKYISFWREYPDIFIDTLLPPDSSFKLFFYQRVFLRAAIRHKYCYGTFPRAFSKSFLAVLVLIIRCILYPGAKLFIVSGTKEQGASIAKEKIEELKELIPALKNEINERKSLYGKDYVRVQFKNGSRLDVVAARESTRGGRRHGGLIEEVILIDGQRLNEIILPLMNVSRRTKNGFVDDKESLNKSQVYVTTAGYKNSFSYDKLLQLLIWQIVKPESAFIFGGTFRIPVMHKLLDRNFVKDLKMDGTFNENSFSREYESEWSGSVEDAFFKPELFDKHRVLKQPEYEFSGRTTIKSYYILSVDVGRIGCQSSIMVFKVVPQVKGLAFKNLVNSYSFDEEHFGLQAIKIKRLYYKYNPQAIVIDGNGLGIGLIDFMVVPSVDEITGEAYPPFGIINDPDNLYRNFITSDTEKDVVYIIKANAEINTEAHTNVLSQISSGKVKFLIDERAAKAKFLSTKVGNAASAVQRANYLKPFTLTSILREEMLNLVEKREGKYLVLESVNKKIKRDKFSSFEYGLYYIKMLEDQAKKKKHGRIEDFMFYSHGGK